MTNFFSLLELLMSRRPAAAGLARRAAWVGLLFVLLLLGRAAKAQSEPAQQAAELAWQTRQQWASPDVAAADLRISSAHTEAPGLLYAYPQQLQAGIPVYNQVVTLVFKNGKLAHHAGSFLSTKAFAGQSDAPRIAAARAVAVALATLPGHPEVRPAAQESPTGPDQQQRFAPAGVARRPIVARLVWTKDKNQQPRLAWNVNVDVLASADWLNIRVDAATGQVLGQDNWTVNEGPATARAAAPNRTPHAPVLPAARPQARSAGPASTLAVTLASYLVVPFPGARPDITPLTTDTNPWLRAGAGNAAITHGWHFDGATNYLDTRGNNVWAYDDSLNTSAPGRFATSTGTSSSLVFNYRADFTKVPTLGKNRRGATVNLFYWNNVMHDVLYQYGFTEASGNFQTDNQGRGGAGADYVRAEAQDGGGTDNANFSTPPDGTNSRMQTYLWNPATSYSLVVTAPASIARTYNMAESAVSPNNLLINKGPTSGTLAYYTDAGTGAHDACASPSSTSVLGKIALIYRYGRNSNGSLSLCSYPVTKIQKAQAEGAIAVVVVNNSPGAPFTMGGSASGITIPAVMVSGADGAILAGQLDAAATVQLTLNPPPTPPQFDGDFDSGLIAHEYGHGLSNRLTGGAANTSCLDNAEQAGEGWSDFFALMMTTNWTTAQTTDGPKVRPMGTYVLNQGPTDIGIRRYPYSTSLAVNPLTYANVAMIAEPHYIGEIWAATLWDMTWNIIQQQGRIEPNLYNSTSTGGNVVALQLVVQGLKLQTCQPGFLDSRDAILAADSLLYNGRYHCAIWGAFARRGMGFSAREGLSGNTTDQTAAYDLPGLNLHKNQVPVVGNQFALNISATCECQTPGQASVSITDQLPTGLQYVSSTGGTLSGRTVTFAGLSFAQGQRRTFQILARTAAGAGCAVALPVNDNREANTAGGFTPAVVTSGGGNAWAPSTALAHSGTTAWSCGDPSVASDVTLTSAAFTPGAFSVLSFHHRFYLKPRYDGGLVAISVNNGAWQDAAPYFLLNGYNTTFANAAVSRGKPCFSGQNPSAFLSGPAAFQQSVVDLTAFSGQSIRVRFQFQSYNLASATTNLPGWFIDDIQVQSGCGGLQQVQLLNSANAVTDSYAQATFLTPLPPIPVLTLLTPSAGGLGQTITLTGTGLGTPTALTINGANALADIIRNTGTTLVVRVPLTAAATGVVSLGNAAGTATAPFAVMAPPGNALAFDGVNDYVAGTNAQLPQGNAPRTLEAWVNPTNTGCGLFIYGTNATNQRAGLSLLNNRLYYAGSNNDLIGNTALVPGHWYHVAATFDGTTLRLYVNGVLDAFQAKNFNTTGTDWRMGTTTLTGTTPIEVLAGRLDEVRVYNTAHTAAQIQADRLRMLPLPLAADLVAYHNFDQGLPATTGTGNNADLTTLYDLASASPGTLTNFSLASGTTTSNYVASYALAVPTATAASSAASGSFTATWTAPAIGTVTGYLLDVSTTPDFSQFVSGSPFAAVATATSLPMSGLPGGRAYYYRVRALNSNLAQPDQGAYSNTAAADVPLPVVLTQFTATAQGSAAVRLAWATASEKNSHAFEVERSADGLTFAAIGTVAAAGSSSSARRYDLLDAQLPAGAALLYYRLKQVDLDGTFSYSPVRVVTLTGAAAGLSLYPNPAHGGAATLTGALPGTVVTVYDALGRPVATATADAAGTAALVLPAGLASGVYVVRADTRAVRLTIE